MHKSYGDPVRSVSYKDPKTGELKKSNRYYTRVRIETRTSDPVTGEVTTSVRRTWEALGTSKKKEAEAKVEKFRAEALLTPAQIRAAKAAATTLAGAVQTWLDEKRSFTRFPVYEVASRYWLTFWGANKPLGEISRDDVRSFLRARKTRQIQLPPREGEEPKKRKKKLAALTATTRNEEARYLKTFFSWCLDEGLLTASPMVKIAKEPETPREQVYELSDDDQAKLLRACADPVTLEISAARNTGGVEGGSVTEDERKFKQTFSPAAWLEPLVKVALTSGLRRRTLCELQWRHVDLATSKWNIPGTAIKTQEAYSQGMLAKCCAALKSWRSYRLMKEGAGAVKPEARVFGLTDASSISRTFSRAVARSGLELSLHDLRRIFCQRVVDATDDTQKALAITGHKSISTLMTFYLRKEKNVDAAAVIAALDGVAGAKGSDAQIKA